MNHSIEKNRFIAASLAAMSLQELVMSGVFARAGAGAAAAEGNTATAFKTVLSKVHSDSLLPSTLPHPQGGADEGSFMEGFSGGMSVSRSLLSLSMESAILGACAAVVGGGVPAAGAPEAAPLEQLISSGVISERSNDALMGGVSKPRPEEVARAEAGIAEAARSTAIALPAAIRTAAGIGAGVAAKALSKQQQWKQREQQQQQQQSPQQEQLRAQVPTLQELHQQQQQEQLRVQVPTFQEPPQQQQPIVSYVNVLDLEASQVPASVVSAAHTGERVTWASSPPSQHAPQATVAATDSPTTATDLWPRALSAAVAAVSDTRPGECQEASFIFFYFYALCTCM